MAERSLRAPAPALSQWEDVRYFLAVVRESSFSGAARVLGTEQSTVSRRIAVLEESLGTPLFERGRRRVRLTPQAEAILAPAEAAERAILAVEDAARGSELHVRGRVRLALTEGLAQHVVVPRVLPDLFSAHPGLSIELRTSDAVADLERHEADVALRFFRPARGELVGRKVAVLPLAVLVARGKKKAFAKLRPEALPWTSYEPAQGAPADMPEVTALGRLGATSRLLCSSVETQMAAVRAGLGVAVAPAALAQVVPGLAVLPMRVDLGALEIYVLTRASIRRVPRVAVVYEALVRVFDELGKTVQAS